MDEIIGYLIFQSYLVRSKIKGELPDVKYKYVAKTSDIGYHFDLTRNRKDAYVFHSEAYTYEQVKYYADLLEMKVKEVV